MVDDIDKVSGAFFDESTSYTGALGCCPKRVDHHTFTQIEIHAT